MSKIKICKSPFVSAVIGAIFLGLYIFGISYLAENKYLTALAPMMYIIVTACVSFTFYKLQTSYLANEQKERLRKLLMVDAEQTIATIRLLSATEHPSDNVAVRVTNIVVFFNPVVVNQALNSGLFCFEINKVLLSLLKNFELYNVALRLYLENDNSKIRNLVDKLDEYRDLIHKDCQLLEILLAS